MLARIWVGAVRTPDAERYLELMRSVALPDYGATPGNLGAWCLHREDGGRVIVSMLTLWRDLEAVAAFAGADATRAKYYDFDAGLLVDAPERVTHFDVLAG